MRNRLLALVLGFIGGIAGNLIAGWIQQDVWRNIFTPPRLLATAVAAGIVLAIAAWLEGKGEEERRTIHLPETLSGQLSEPFRRYFASVLERPFYPLPDQLKIIEDTRAALTEKRGNLIIVLDGAAGVGKTTIASQLVREAGTLGFLGTLGDSAKLKVYEDSQIRRVDEPAVLEWPELINTLLVQLGSPSLISDSLSKREAWVHSHLRLEKYLVLVDNLESIEGAREIVTQLRTLLRGTESRGLVTYRYRDLAGFSGVSSINVTGLSRADSLSFLHEELQAKGAGGLKEWLEARGNDQETLERIIRLVNGLPLALQLIVGLSATLPLTSVYRLLDNVPADTSVEELYEFLYQEELDRLPENTRNFLLTNFSRRLGYFYGELAATSGLSDDTLLNYLVDLSQLSLVYSINLERPEGGREDYFYIHPMLHRLLRKRSTVEQNDEAGGNP